MFEELKKRVEVESTQTKERLATLQEDVRVIKEKQETSVLPKARKRLPCNLSVSHHCTLCSEALTDALRFVPALSEKSS